MRIVQLASSWPTSAMKAYTLYPCSTSHARMQEVSVDLSIRGQAVRWTSRDRRTKSTRIRQQYTTRFRFCHDTNYDDGDQKRIVTRLGRNTLHNHVYRITFRSCFYWRPISVGFIVIVSSVGMSDQDRFSVSCEVSWWVASGVISWF